LRKFDVNSIRTLNDPHISVLSQAIDEALVRIFGSDTVDYERYVSASHLRSGGLYLAGYEPSIRAIQEEVEEGRAKAIATLDGIVARFQEELEQVLGLAQAPESRRAQALRTESRQVFVVHGHDEGARESVARFLERIGCEPIILHERPNKGRTLITKFREEAAGVGFAVVLMTPDDHGATADEANTNPRTRQNVVVELGFFIGAFGPDRVAALVKGGIERPSDFDGVVYIDLDDADGWKQQLGRELSAAGFEIDWNKVMRS
jgi:predicted nucleotide-binding protein